MSTRRRRTAAAAFVLAGSVILLPVGMAHADCTTAGDFGAGSGCAPPGGSSGSGNAESWPPTSVDWPPKLSSDSGNDNGGDSGGKGGSGGGGGGTQPTPIVMPGGQKPAPATPSSGSNSTSTSTPPKPIVAVGAAPTGTTPGATTSTTPTPIVAAPH
jgi:hypothetical protein